MRARCSKAARRRAADEPALRRPGRRASPTPKRRARRGKTAEKLGLKTYTAGGADAAGNRIRVRVGPFASRGEAEAALAKAKAAGLNAVVAHAVKADDEWPTLGWVDLAMLGVIVVSALVGMVRGLTFELLSLAGWVVAWFAALLARRRWLAPHLPIGAPASRLERRRRRSHRAFLVVLVLWGLLARGVSALVGATCCARSTACSARCSAWRAALLVLLALATVVALHAAGRRLPAWRESAGAALVERDAARVDADRRAG